MFDSISDLILHLSIISESLEGLGGGGFSERESQSRANQLSVCVVAKTSVCANSDLKYKNKRAVVDTHITGKRKNMCTCGLKIVTSFVNQYFPFRLGMKLTDKFLLMPLHTM